MTNFNRNTLHTRRRWLKFSSIIILYIVSIQILLCSARPHQDLTNGEKTNETDAGVIKAMEELPPSSEAQPYPRQKETGNEGVSEMEVPEEGEDAENEELDCDENDDAENCNTETISYPNKPYNKFTEPKSTSSTTTERSDDENPPDEPDETTTPVSEFNTRTSDTRPLDQPDPTASTIVIPIRPTTIENEQRSSTSPTITTIKIGGKPRNKGSTVTNSISILTISVFLIYFS